MLRLTEVKLPLDHPESALRDAILKKLGIPPAQLLRFNIHRRGFDARKHAEIALVYTLDIEVDNEAALLKRLRGDRVTVAQPGTGSSWRSMRHRPRTLLPSMSLISTPATSQPAGAATPKREAKAVGTPSEKNTITRRLERCVASTLFNCACPCHRPSAELV